MNGLLLQLQCYVVLWINFSGAICILRYEKWKKMKTFSLSRAISNQPRQRLKMLDWLHDSKFQFFHGSIPWLHGSKVSKVHGSKVLRYQPDKNEKKYRDVCTNSSLKLFWEVLQQVRKMFRWYNIIEQ